MSYKLESLNFSIKIETLRSKNYFRYLESLAIEVTDMTYLSETLHLSWHLVCPWVTFKGLTFKVITLPNSYILSFKNLDLVPIYFQELATGFYRRKEISNFLNLSHAERFWNWKFLTVIINMTS